MVVQVTSFGAKLFDLYTVYHIVNDCFILCLNKNFNKYNQLND